MQECFVLNHEANSASELEQFRFFGNLIGFATRTGQCFNVDIHPMVWKAIVGQPLDLEYDLKTSDLYAYQMLKKIIDCAKLPSTEEEFQAAIEYQNFTVFISSDLPN